MSVQGGLAALFAVATIATTLSVNGLQFLDPTINVQLNQQTLLQALPGTLAFLAILGDSPKLGNMHLVSQIQISLASILVLFWCPCFVQLPNNILL